MRIERKYTRKRKGGDSREARAIVRDFAPKNRAEVELEGRVMDIYIQPSGWGLLRLAPKLEMGLADYTVTLTGSTIPQDVYEGAQVVGHGFWSKHPTYGWQVKARRIDFRLSTEEVGVRLWFERHCPDVGPVRARALQQHFGEELWTVIAAGDPQPLLEVEGVGPKVAESVVGTFAYYEAERVAYAELADMQLGGDRIRQAVTRFGVRDAAHVIRQDPYRLMEIPACGFKEADRIATKGVGLAYDDPRRMAAGYNYAATILERAGDTAHSARKLQSTAASRDVLRSNLREVAKHWEAALEGEQIVGEYGAWFRVQTADFEHRIAEQVAQLLKATGRTDEGSEGASPWQNKVDWQVEIVSAHRRAVASSPSTPFPGADDFGDDEIPF